jgi:hypothetical protein
VRFAVRLPQTYTIEINPVTDCDDRRRMSSGRVAGLLAALALWLGCLGAGFSLLEQHAAKAGRSFSPTDEKQFFAAHRQGNRPLLVMAVHPRCPCSRASLGELGDLLARSRGACDALLLQYVPDVRGDDWPADSISPELGGIKTKVVLDRGGRLAAALGAVTSGHVVFFDAEGKVRFAGGLTLSRGHRGRAPAQDAILQVLAGVPPKVTSAPVFGCALEPECTPPKT